MQHYCGIGIQKGLQCGFIKRLQSETHFMMSETLLNFFNDNFFFFLVRNRAIGMLAQLAQGPSQVVESLKAYMINGQ